MDTPTPPAHAFNLDTKEAAEYLRVHPYTLKAWAKAGKVAYFKTPGGWYRFRREDLDALVGDSARSAS